jgi:type IV pilus assembly protein PilN
MSIRINLLPHREARRALAKKTFYGLTLAAFLAGLGVVFLVWSVLQANISRQETRNEFIRAENRKLDAQIKEIATLRQEIDALRARQRAVEDLQADRNLPVHLLAELVKQTPEGVFLKSLKQEGNKVTITGWASSNERVSEFLRNISANGTYIEKPDLIEIKVAAQSPPGVARRVFDFGLSFMLRPTQERKELQAQNQAQAQGQAAKRPAGAAPAPTTPAPAPAAPTK